MEGYRREKVEEEPMVEEQIPIPNLPRDFIWMQVKTGSKMRNLLEYAYGNFPQAKTIIWTGYGEALVKAISCAEILKRKYKGALYQITKIQYRKVTEHWVSVTDNMDKKSITKRHPMIHVCLSYDPIGPQELGFQKPEEIMPCRRMVAVDVPTEHNNENDDNMFHKYKKMKTE